MFNQSDQKLKQRASNTLRRLPIFPEDARRVLEENDFDLKRYLSNTSYWHKQLERSPGKSNEYRKGNEK